MPRLLAAAALLPFLLAVTPAAAVTTQQKAETCKVGADEQNLEGAKRKTFIAKCMGKGNYEPQGRRDLKKKSAKTKPKKTNMAPPPPADLNANPPPAPKQ